MEHRAELIALLSAQPSFYQELELVRSLGRPDWCIAAGYVRNCVWDHLHGYLQRTPLDDVDILLYDPADLSEENEKRLEKRLRSLDPRYKWSVKNQARMHLRNGDAPYASIEDAMSRWPETATAVGVRLDAEGGLVIVAPHGLEDLFGLALRQGPSYPDREAFLNRVAKKRWLELWPRLRIAGSR